MSGEVTLSSEVLAADLTDKGTLSSVGPHMSGKVTLLSTAFAADLADEGSLASV